MDGCRYAKRIPVLLRNAFRIGSPPNNGANDEETDHPFAHGVIDYATSAALVAAPKLMRLDRRASAVAYALGGGYAALSMLTEYPLGVKQVVPFKAHGVTEGAIGAVLPALPFALGFASQHRARNLFFGLTALTAVVSLLTDWDKRSERSSRRSFRR